MPLRPIDLLVNFLGMKQSTDKVEQLKNNVSNQQIAASLDSQVESKKNTNKIADDQNLESSKMRSDFFDQKHHSSYSGNSQQNHHRQKKKSTDHQSLLVNDMDKDVVHATKKGQQVDIKK